MLSPVLGSPPSCKKPPHSPFHLLRTAQVVDDSTPSLPLPRLIGATVAT